MYFSRIRRRIAFCRWPAGAVRHVGPLIARCDDIARTLRPGNDLYSKISSPRGVVCSKTDALYLGDIDSLIAVGGVMEKRSLPVQNDFPRGLPTHRISFADRYFFLLSSFLLICLGSLR